MPIMVKSSVCVLTQNRHIQPLYTGECDMDCGGYFIIKGSEKTVLGQERAAETVFIVSMERILQNGRIMRKSNLFRILNVFRPNKLK